MWPNPKEGPIGGTVKIGDHTVDLEGTNPGNSEIQFTTKDEAGSADLDRKEKRQG